MSQHCVYSDSPALFLPVERFPSRLNSVSADSTELSFSTVPSLVRRIRLFSSQSLSSQSRRSLVLYMRKHFPRPQRPARGGRGFVQGKIEVIALSEMFPGLITSNKESRAIYLKSVFARRNAVFCTACNAPFNTFHLFFCLCYTNSYFNTTFLGILPMFNTRRQLQKPASSHVFLPPFRLPPFCSSQTTS